VDGPVVRCFTGGKILAQSSGVLAMNARAEPNRRRPTFGQWVALIVAEGLVLLAGAVVGALTDWPGVRWIVAAVVVLVLVRWFFKLRSPSESQWGGDTPGHYYPHLHGYDGQAGSP